MSDRVSRNQPWFPMNESLSALRDFVTDLWHRGRLDAEDALPGQDATPLSEALGMTPETYAQWAATGKTPTEARAAADADLAREEARVAAAHSELLLHTLDLLHLRYDEVLRSATPEGIENGKRRIGFVIRRLLVEEERAIVLHNETIPLQAALQITQSLLSELRMGGTSNVREKAADVSDGIRAAIQRLERARMDILQTVVPARCPLCGGPTTLNTDLIGWLTCPRCGDVEPARASVE